MVPDVGTSSEKTIQEIESLTQGISKKWAKAVVGLIGIVAGLAVKPKQTAKI